MNRKEDCRHQCLEFLVARPRLAFSADTIRRSINRAGGDFTDTEVAEALEFLVGLKHVTVNPDGLGATRYYKAGSEGILFIERGQ